VVAEQSYIFAKRVEELAWSIKYEPTAFRIREQILSRPNERLGFGADMRDYSMCGSMLEHLGAKRVELMTNNPRKIKAMTELGIEVVERKPLMTKSNPHNSQYLSTKAGKLGHLIEDDNH
jgi:GTP cyclohydrolase II